MLAPLLARRPPCLARPLFTLPDLSAFAPGSSNANGSDGDGENMTYHERRILPFTRRQLFDVVADMSSYPRFVPYCKGVSIITPPKVVGPGNTTEEEASMTAGFLGFTETYTSRVTCKPYDSVEAVAISSTPLFKSLATTWRFQPASSQSPHPTAGGLPPPVAPPATDLIPEAGDPDTGPTLVTLDLAYAFANPLHAAVSRAFFGQVSKMMVEAFETRCLDVYGPQNL